MRRCADGDLVEFHGEFHDLPPMDPEPRPVQRPIPILVGGHSDVALERAGRIGDGWIAAQMSPERVAEHWPRVLESAERNGRDPGSLRLFTSISRRVDLPLVDLLGDPFVSAFTIVKEAEYEVFLQVISSWEREHLLLNV